MGVRQSEPANDELYVRVLPADVDSLLAQLPVQFPLISAGHPFPVVLVNGCAADDLRTNFGFCLGVVNAYAMAPGWPWTSYQEHSNYIGAKSQLVKSASHFVHRPSQCSIAFK